MLMAIAHSPKNNCNKANSEKLSTTTLARIATKNFTNWNPGKLLDDLMDPSKTFACFVPILHFLKRRKKASQSSKNVPYAIQGESATSSLCEDWEWENKV